MKKLTIILLASLISGYLAAKPKEFISKKEFVEFKSDLSDSIQSLNNKIIEQKKDIKRLEDKNEVKLKDASATIKYLSSLVGSFGVVFTVLTCIIALITLGLPILTYQFGIKPSQKALRDLELNMDSRLEKYLKDNRDKQIEQAFANLQSESTELKSQGLNFLALTHHQGFTDSQMFKIYSLLKKNLYEQATKGQLSFVLSSRKNDYADELFNDKKYLGDPAIKQMALIYFVKTGFENNVGGLRKMIQLSSDKSQEYFSILINVMTYASGDLMKILNNQELIAELDENAIKKLKENYKHYLSAINVTEDEFNGTELNKTINTSA